MQIGAAARASGATARSLRHYEVEGLIVPGRCSNGFRDYCQSSIDRVIVIRSLLESGLSVRLIRAVLPLLTDDLGASPDAIGAEFLHEVQSYRDRLAARIAVLSRQQTALDVYLRGNGVPLHEPALDVDTSVKPLASVHGPETKRQHTAERDDASTGPAVT